MKQPFIIGGMVIGAIILLITLSKWGGLSWSDSSFPVIKIFFENVNGLKKNDPVYVHGYQVGYVSNIQLQDSGCLVTVKLKEDILIATDAQAEIQIKELMAGKQVVLWPGNSGKKLSQPIYGKSTFDWAVGLSKLGETLGGQNLPDMLHNLHLLSKSLLNFTDSLSTIQMHVIVSELRQTMAQLRKLTTDLQNENILIETKQTLQSVRRLTDDIQPRLQKTFSLADSSLEMLPETLKLLQLDLKEADTLIKKLQKQLSLLDKPGTVVWSALHDTLLISRIDSTVYNFNKTLDHIRTKKIHVNLSLSPKKKTYQE